ncbi:MULTISPECIES: hypothetical protein [unclassified Burkholderia]|uniref:hypothetical protein n=1 Tax=unclassified Burkholderia TaxID=2613784 RepID=UPI00075B3945|nr:MULTISPECIES: hypothetical protein [unclassified Burkholderia]AOI79589.1 hypothetical protein WS54_25555 [Burkholderia sp. NRF60-BP8]KVA15064.1 hypothetical protein WS54_00400 [Burkholderia sp. NRF60-BP8]KVL20659.1 hypothetical protein WS95_12720 [Burkholderia sp. MSMB1826]
MREINAVECGHVSGGFDWSNGKPMPMPSLPACKPGTLLNLLANWLGGWRENARPTPMPFVTEWDGVPEHWLRPFGQ